jgi:hypothetical protein
LHALIVLLHQIVLRAKLRAEVENQFKQALFGGAMMLRNSLEVMILVFFQKAGKWRWFPVIK